MKRRAFMRSGALAVFAAGWGGLPAFVHAAATEQLTTVLLLSGRTSEVIRMTCR